jgi:hypothetical protein
VAVWRPSPNGGRFDAALSGLTASAWMPVTSVRRSASS